MAEHKHNLNSLSTTDVQGDIRNWGVEGKTENMKTANNSWDEGRE
jgi:hypothetical protein